MSSNNRRARFFVTITSAELSLVRLTELIGQSPDTGWSKDDTYMRGGQEKTYRFSRWSLAEEAEGEANDWEQCIDALLTRSAPLSERIRQLPSGITPEFLVQLTEKTTIFGFGLSIRQIERLANLGASLDMSIVIEGATDQDWRGE